MKIGIDARLINETGVGRYIRNLIDQLGNLDRENHYIVFLRKNAINACEVPNDRWEKRVADVPWHSISEQFIMPWLLIKEHLDLVHVPYFNIPIFYPGKFVVTIHDLTILHFDTGKASTLPILLYKLRLLGYLVGLSVGLKRASHILTVSNTTKQEIVDHFSIEPDKIEVTFEGVDGRFSRQSSVVSRQKKLIKEPYFLYVGNAYPHKNLEMLLRAFQNLISQGLALPRKARPYENESVRLVLVGKDDFFYHQLVNFVDVLGLHDRVMFFGPANDSELGNLYTHAIALVFPSLMEGFGLPGLEAMALGTSVVCSDIPIFHEVYGDAVLYFDQNNPEDISAKLMTITSSETVRKRLIAKGKTRLKKYSWATLAKQTLRVYAYCIRL